jgi:hypothetical protein
MSMYRRHPWRHDLVVPAGSRRYTLKRAVWRSGQGIPSGGAGSGKLPRCHSATTLAHAAGGAGVPALCHVAHHLQRFRFSPQRQVLFIYAGGYRRLWSRRLIGATLGASPCQLAQKLLYYLVQCFWHCILVFFLSFRWSRVSAGLLRAEVPHMLDGEPDERSVSLVHSVDRSVCRWLFHAKGVRILDAGPSPSSYSSRWRSVTSCAIGASSANDCKQRQSRLNLPTFAPLGAWRRTSRPAQ